jgi:hypothetical protein
VGWDSDLVVRVVEWEVVIERDEFRPEVLVLVRHA